MSGSAWTRLLFLLPNLQGGGAERVIVTLLRHLDRRRFEPILALADSGGPVYLDDLPEDIDLIDLKSRRIRNVISGILRVVWRHRPKLISKAPKPSVCWLPKFALQPEGKMKLLAL